MVPNHARYQLRYASIDILSFNVQVAGYTHVLARRKGNALLGRRSHDVRCSLVSAAKTTGDRCFEKCVLVLARRKDNALLGRRSHGGGARSSRPPKQRVTVVLRKCVLVLMALNHARNLLRYASIDILSFNSRVAGRHCLR